MFVVVTTRISAFISDEDCKTVSDAGWLAAASAASYVMLTRQFVSRRRSSSSSSSSVGVKIIWYPVSIPSL